MSPQPEDPQDSQEQPPPPDPGEPGPNAPSPGDKSHPHDNSELSVQLAEIHAVVGKLLTQTNDEAIARRNEYVPVRTSDLMRGFQAAVARANRAALAGNLGGEDIETMAIKDLRVAISAPVIDGGHAEDPTLMLPNIKSVDQDSSRISLEFTVISMPSKART